MITYKALDKSNVFTTDCVAEKHWEISGSMLKDMGIQVLIAKSGSLPYYPVDSDKQPFLRGQQMVSGSYPSGSYYPRLLYHSVKNQYYDDSLGNGVFSGSRDLSIETSLTISGSRTLPSTTVRDDIAFLVVSIPTKCFGKNIKEGTCKIFFPEDASNYVKSDYVEREYFSEGRIGDIKEREGVLFYEGTETSQMGLNEGDVIGDVILSQGLIIVTNLKFVDLFLESIPGFVSWTSELPVFTENVSCKVLDSEFNYSTNPTAKAFIGDPNFTPYITSIGLYNSEGDLLAIGKLSKPVRKLDNIDMTLNIRIDIS